MQTKEFAVADDDIVLLLTAYAQEVLQLTLKTLSMMPLMWSKAAMKASERRSLTASKARAAFLTASIASLYSATWACSRSCRQPKLSDKQVAS